ASEAALRRNEAALGSFGYKNRRPVRAALAGGDRLWGEIGEPRRNDSRAPDGLFRAAGIHDPVFLLRSVSPREQTGRRNLYNDERSEIRSRSRLSSRISHTPARQLSKRHG